MLSSFLRLRHFLQEKRDSSPPGSPDNGVASFPGKKPRLGKTLVVEKARSFLGDVLRLDGYLVRVPHRNLRVRDVSVNEAEARATVS